MRKIIAMAVCLVTLLSVFSICSSAATQNEVAPYLNNPCITSSDGSISNVTGATVKIKIQKRFLLVFWNNVIEWTDETTENNYTVVHSTNVGSGTYRATVEYTIYGTGGEPDVIKDEIQRTH